MKTEKFLSKWFALFILAAGLGFASCSEDDNDIPSGEVTPPTEKPETEHVVNPAGNNFYMYVNEQWHKGLTQGEEIQGYMADVDNQLPAKVGQAVGSDEIFTKLVQALGKAAANQAASEAKVEAVINSVLGDVKTKNDAFKAIGKCIGMGFGSMFKLCLAIDDEVVGYCIASGIEDEDNSRGVEVGFNQKHRLKALKRMTAVSREANAAMTNIIAGIGLDPDYYMHDEAVDNDLKELNGYSKSKLVEIIRESIKAELLPYCADKYAVEYSGGALKDMTEYFQGTMMNDLSYPISYLYAKKYVTPDVKQAFKGYAEELRSAFNKRIQNNAWLSAQTKQAAQDKLAKMKFFIGEPDEWVEEGFPKPAGNSMVDDMMEVKKSRVRLVAAMQGKDKREHSLMWGMYDSEGINLYEYNAFYAPQTNAIHILPAFMMAPEYTPDMKASKMYAAFFVMAHEMTHGFDLEGAGFDAEGLEKNWWTAEDKAKFEALNKKLIQQISQLEAAPGIKANGAKTVTEDVADLGGINIAFDALNEVLKKNGMSAEQMNAEYKGFFEHYAYRFRTWYPAEELKAQLEDVHSVATVRVNGMVQHMDKWYELYKVVEGDSLYLPKDKRVTIW